MSNRIWFEIAVGPALFAGLALFNAATASGTPWRARLRRLTLDLRDCVVALVLLAALFGTLRSLGIAGAAKDISCQPSPNGKICEDE